MKIAVTTEGNMVFPHFGRSPQFTVYDIEDKKIKGKEILENPGHDVGVIPDFLKNKGVDLIITGGMGMRARELFRQYEIGCFVGIEGAADDAVNAYLNSALEEGDSICQPGSGKGIGIEKDECHHLQDD
ncbi:MAG: NifB/NifX family molybdenum-iron cluster-binding protein [Actinomycetota bacterium]|nr:NifB/NifX family molybdenum-iron cluster-binding protein [Actinomycetota bacterium]